MTEPKGQSRITIRVPDPIRARLDKVRKANKAYTPTITDVVVRGMELALRELERK